MQNSQPAADNINYNTSQTGVGVNQASILPDFSTFSFLDAVNLIAAIFTILIGLNLVMRNR